MLRFSNLRFVTSHRVKVRTVKILPVMKFRFYTTDNPQVKQLLKDKVEIKVPAPDATMSSETTAHDAATNLKPLMILRLAYQLLITHPR